MLTKNEQFDQDAQAVEAKSDKSVGNRSWFWTGFRGLAQLILMTAVLFAGVVGMNRLTALKEDRPKRPPFKTVYTVDSVTAVRGLHQPDMLVYGEIQAAKTIELRPLVNGKIIEINPSLKVGASIEKGEKLFSVDPFSYETALDSSKSNAAESKAKITENEAKIAIEESRIKSMQDQLEIAENDLNRITQLRERGTATAKDVEDRKLIVSQRTQSLEQSKLNLVAERARMEQQKNVLSRFERAIMQAERDLGDTTLFAPVSGIISVNNAAVGRYVGPSDMTVALYEADRLEVRFTLTDQRYGRIQSDKTGIIGREVEVIWSVGGEEFRYPATIERIGAQIASTRGGVEVIAVIERKDMKGGLRPGAFVEIIVPDKAFESHFRIPETALYNGDTVYVIEEGELSPREVQVLASDGRDVILGGSLEDGAEVMTTKIAEISKGIRVRTNQSAEADGANGQ